MRNSWSMRSGNTEQSGQFVAQENSLGLSMMWLSEIWRRLMICGQNQPCLLVWVSIHSKIRLDIYTRWRVMFHIGNVSGGCWVNPWPKTNSLLGEALFCDNALPTRSRWCSNYHNWRNMRGLSSDSMCQIVWHDIVRRMAWFVSGAYCFEMTLDAHLNLLWCMRVITGWMQKCYDVTARMRLWALESKHRSLE